MAGFSIKDLNLQLLVCEGDIQGPPEWQAKYKTQEYQDELAQDIVRTREQLDSGLGDKVFDLYRSNEKTHQCKYLVIVIGALFMRAGAKIRDGDFQHLRDLVPEIPCRADNASFDFDEVFRAPGKAQFLAALDHYIPGTPRNFYEPSCFTCGKIEADIGKAPLACSRCKRAWYCDATCQTAHWKNHKVTCVRPAQPPGSNVQDWRVAGDPGDGASPVSVKRIRFLIIIPKFQNTSPDSAGSRVNPNAMSCSGAVDTDRQMAPSAAKQQKKSAFSCHNCRSRKLINASSAPTLSYTERLEQRIKELENEVQRLKGSHGDEAEAQTPKTPEDASVSESSGRQPTDQLKQRLSGSYDGLKVDDKGVITYHGATSFFQAMAGDPSKGPDNEEQDDAGSSRSAQDMDRRQRLVNNAWHQRALECFTNIPEPFHYLLDLHWCWIQPLFNFVYRPAFTRTPPLFPDAIMSHSTRWAKRDPVIREQLGPYEQGALFRRQARSFLFEELNRGVCTIPMIQTLLLLSAQECSSGNATQAWVYSGIAFRLVDHLGIFIDGQRYSADVHLSEEEVEIRHRLFWSCYFWDKIISLYLGRRPTLTHVSVSPPGFMYDDSAEEEMWIPHGVTFAPGKQYPPTPAHSTSCFIKMCELSVIFNQILINIYDPLQQLSPSVIEGCVRTRGKHCSPGGMLCRTFSALTRTIYPFTRHHPISSHSSHSLYHTFKILLFRPTLVKRSRQSAGERTQNQDHLRICVASAVSIAAIFDLFCRTFGEDHCITSLSYSLYIATSIFLLQAQALPGDTQTLRRLLLCVQYLERVQTINPVIGSALRPIKEAIAKMGLEQPTVPPQSTTIPTTTAEAQEGSTLSSPGASAAGYEPDGLHHAVRPSRDFHSDQFGTVADVDFSLMPDDMFEALSTLEPMSVSIQPLDQPNLSSQQQQPVWPFTGR
ncbi:C6 transcription factor [Apiospora phragmitis]|uniref:C6 transcription factor n=1 Tax=Apiospora phragmitis TaxID=2905665 RepID=A0ABR1VH66_9PEZI